MGIFKHSQSSQNSKLAMPLQYLKKKRFRESAFKHQLCGEGEATFVAFAPNWCFLKEAGYIAANHPMPIKQAKRSLRQALWYK